MDTLAVWAQIISVPLAIIAILVSIWLYRRGRLHRAISCYFDPLISPIEVKAGDAFMGDIKIFYQDRPIQNLFILRVNIKNTGNMAIRASDTFKPISFTFAEGTEIVRSPRVISSKPSNLNFDWSIVKDEVKDKADSAVLNFDLLNPGDEQTVEFIYTGNNKLPLVTARIEGLSGIETANTNDPIRRRRILGLILYVLSAFGTIIFMIKTSSTPINSFASLIQYFFAFLLFSFVGFLLLSLLVLPFVDKSEKHKVPPSTIQK